MVFQWPLKKSKAHHSKIILLILLKFLLPSKNTE